MTTPAQSEGTAVRPHQHMAVGCPDYWPWGPELPETFGHRDVNTPCPFAASLLQPYGSFFPPHTHAHTFYCWLNFKFFLNCETFKKTMKLWNLVPCPSSLAHMLELYNYTIFLNFLCPSHDSTQIPYSFSSTVWSYGAAHRNFTGPVFPFLSMIIL